MQVPEPGGEVPTLRSPDPLTGHESTGGFSLHHDLLAVHQSRTEATASPARRLAA